MYTTASLYSQQHTQQQRTIQPVQTLNRTHDSQLSTTATYTTTKPIPSTEHTTAMYTTASTYYRQFGVQQSTLQLVCTPKSTQDSNVHYSQRAPAVQNLERRVCNKCPWNDIAIPTPIPM